ncbi:MAG: type II toxin-antitoxin system RelE/ParE family toxin [Trichormus sp. ATA11-4-KO1]|jgi:mRNA interferase RelE/StbE|nr:type II toxin-antitoxin system RelE/ParE family toxin [Trichormus sp. ATA11-4-KO1]
MYTIWIFPKANHQFLNLFEPTQREVGRQIDALAATPIPANALRVSGTEGWRIYVDDYRVIYEVQDGQKIVLILDIRHRLDYGDES